MKVAALGWAVALAMTGPALAQDPHAHHAAPAADPHAGHHAPTPATPPPAPSDHSADRVYPEAEMEAARAKLRREHGDVAWRKVEFQKLELRPGSGTTGYAWEARASFGRDLTRFELRSRGEGAGKVEHAEAQALVSRAVSPWFDLQAGLRQDFEPRARTYALVGVTGLAPYEFDLDGQVFLSDRGDVTGRIEAAHDYRLTQRLILEPRAEANFAAQDVTADRIGAGLSSLELGLRLRYGIRPELAPYVGLSHERRLGRAARLARAAGEDARETRFVLGIRSWF